MGNCSRASPVPPPPLTGIRPKSRTAAIPCRPLLTMRPETKASLRSLRSQSNLDSDGGLARVGRPPSENAVAHRHFRRSNERHDRGEKNQAGILHQLSANQHFTSPTAAIETNS